MTVRPGLCSITLRQLSIDEVVDASVRAGVEGIEWGADAHVPPGDLRAAGRARARCAEAGIAVASYGSYLGMGAPEPPGDASKTSAVLDTARELGAPMLRIWTEFGVSPDALPEDRARVVERTAAFVEAAVEHGLTVALEFHPWCLTHTAASAKALLDQLGPEVLTHWQPDPTLAPTDALAELDRVLPRLAHLHVFSWGAAGIADRQPLSSGSDLWVPALELAAGAPPLACGDRFALCEYVPGDDPEQLTADLATLRGWLEHTPGG